MTQQSHLVRILIWIFLAGQVGFFALAWSPMPPALPGLSMQLAPGGMDFDEARGLAALPRLLGVLVALPYLAALAWGVWRLDQLLRVSDPRGMFTARSIGHLQTFAGAATLAALYSILEFPMRSWVCRSLGGFPQDRIKMGVSSEQLLLLLVCGVFYLVINLMHEARRIAHENEGFV